MLGKAPRHLVGPPRPAFLGRGGGRRRRVVGAGPREGVRSASALDLLSPAAWRGQQVRNRPRTGREQASQPQSKALPVARRRPPAMARALARRTGRQQDRSKRRDRSSEPLALLSVSRFRVLSRFRGSCRGLSELSL